MRKKRNRQWLRAAACLLLTLVMMAGCAAGSSPADGTDGPAQETLPQDSGSADTEAPKQTGIIPHWENTAVNGICLGLTGAYSRKLNISHLTDLLGVMNVKAMRNWMHLTTNLTDPHTVKQSMIDRQKGWMEQLRAAGVSKIVGMSHYWFWPESVDLTGLDKNLARSAAPYRDTEEGSLYLEWLALYEQSWYTMAKAYPEITFWEVGNEVNMDLYLHPLSYEKRGTTFTMAEKAEIVTDMLYYASQGIHRANPEAVVIFPGLAPVTGFQCMADFLNRVYGNIESGAFGSGATDTNCYFQAVAWHGYVLQGEFDTDEWIAGNNLVYAVMADHGDGDKKVFLTEFGFSDGGSQETDAQQAAYFEQIYSRLSEMPYVDSIYPFRMLEDTNNTDKTEVYYGMFRVFEEAYFGAKEKAKAICRLYGGDLSGLDRYIGSHSVYGD